MAQRILVVDTDAAILEMLHAVLTDEGYDVRTSKDGNTVQQVPPFYPDLILMDVRIPEMDSPPGTNAPATTPIPIILMTARQRKPHMTQAVVIDFIFKPVDRAELLAKISGVLAASWAKEDHRVCQNDPTRARVGPTPEIARWAYTREGRASFCVRHTMAFMS